MEGVQAGKEELGDLWPVLVALRHGDRKQNPCLLQNAHQAPAMRGMRIGSRWMSAWTKRRRSRALTEA